MIDLRLRWNGNISFYGKNDEAIKIFEQAAVMPKAKIGNYFSVLSKNYRKKGDYASLKNLILQNLKEKPENAYNYFYLAEQSLKIPEKTLIDKIPSLSKAEVCAQNPEFMHLVEQGLNCSSFSLPVYKPAIPDDLFVSWNITHELLASPFRLPEFDLLVGATISNGFENIETTRRFSEDSAYMVRCKEMSFQYAQMILDYVLSIKPINSINSNVTTPFLLSIWQMEEDTDKIKTINIDSYNNMRSRYEENKYRIRKYLKENNFVEYREVITDSIKEGG